MINKLDEIYKALEAADEELANIGLDRNYTVRKDLRRAMKFVEELRDEAR